MPKTTKTPNSVLMSFMNEYQLNAFSLAKELKLSPTSVRLLTIGKAKITVPTALRLSKFFGQTPAFWLDLQREADLNEAAKDKELSAILKGIGKAKKPAAKPKAAAKAKPLRKTTLADKRKAAAKSPGSKAALRKPKVKK